MAGLLTHSRQWLSDHNHDALAQRMAGGAFLIRVASAALAYLTQVVLARWMGSHEFGIYVYVWTWVLLVGGLFDLGLAQSAQRFVPQYTENKQLERLRGFLSGSRWLATMIATAAGIVAAGAIFVSASWIGSYLILPLY